MKVNYHGNCTFCHFWLIYSLLLCYTNAINLYWLLYSIKKVLSWRTQKVYAFVCFLYKKYVNFLILNLSQNLIPVTPTNQILIKWCMASVPFFRLIIFGGIFINTIQSLYYLCNMKLLVICLINVFRWRHSDTHIHIMYLQLIFVRLFYIRRNFWTTRTGVSYIIIHECAWRDLSSLIWLHITSWAGNISY